MGFNAVREKVSGKQASNNIQRQTSRQNVTLGIDIGTQFCFIGYIDDEYNFCDILLTADLSLYGVPTAIAYRRIENENTYKYGQAAIDEDDKVSEQSDRNLIGAYNGNYWILLPESLKTQLRNGRSFKARILNVDTTLGTTQEHLKGFLTYLLQDSIDYRKLGKKKIDKIVIAYPNVSTDGNGYMETLSETLNEVINNLTDKHMNYANDVTIETVNEGKLASVAMAKQLGLENKDIMTVDVGGGTIDLALMSNGVLTWHESYDDYGLKYMIDPKCKDWGVEQKFNVVATFKRKYFAKDDKTDDVGNSITCKNNKEGCKCWECKEDVMANALEEIKNKYSDDMFKPKLDTAEIKNIISTKRVLNVCLLGGGSNMIFIQEALKKAFSDLGYEGIQYWTITLTKGEGYHVVYKKQEDKNENEKNITTANFLAYAAALYGELSRPAEKSREAENDQKLESGTGTEFTGEAADLRIVREVPSLPYAIQYNDNGQAKYVMFPKNSFASDGNIYMIAPVIFSVKEPNDTGTQVDLSKNIVFIKQDRSNIEIKEIQMRAGIMEVAEKIKCDGGERSISADDVNKANTIGPKEIAHKDFTGGEFACVICIKYCGGVFVSYDKKLQIYLYRSPWHDQEQRFVLPNDGEKPYFAAGELTEERKRQLGDAYYDFELKFKDFMERSGQNLKC